MQSALWIWVYFSWTIRTLHDTDIHYTSNVPHYYLVALSSLAVMDLDTTKRLTLYPHFFLFCDSDGVFLRVLADVYSHEPSV